MESSLNQQARAEYAQALRSGQRALRERTSRGERGNLPALDDLTGQTRVIAYMKQPQREISLSRVTGTYTAARANSFAANFMPLHPENSEFASKWMSLCAIHMGEGLRDPVEVYEYLWQYYVIEGNKRVSILKHFGSPTVRADITRVVPQLDEDDPDTAVYYAYLRYDKEGRFKNLRLSSEEAYGQLAGLEANFPERADAAGRPNYNAMYLQFEAAYARVKSPLPLGDAFLEYLKVYGLPEDTTLSEMEDRIVTLLPQLELAGHRPPEPTLVLTPREKPTAGLITRLFGSRRGAKVVFAYPAGRREDNWIGAHEQGRRAMQEKLGEGVDSSFIDGLSPHNVYEKLNGEAGGADLLFITASNLALPALRFSLEHPGCLTLVYSRIREDYRLSTYYGRYYEPVFLCGMAAGMATRSGTVAYVTPRTDYSRHTADINAFGLGARSVRPDVQVLLAWKDVLPYQPLTCQKGLKAAAEQGADIAYTPLYPGLSVPDLPGNVFSAVFRLDGEGTPLSYLAAPQWDWGRFYAEITESFLNGSLDILRVIDRGDPSVTGLWWGLGAGVLRFLSSPAPGVPGGHLLHYLRSGIARDGFDPFRGPVLDAEGRLRVAGNSGLKPFEVLNMEWLCDFIRVI